jgi:putative FmdB family regulatory protein
MPVYSFKCTKCKENQNIRLKYIDYDSSVYCSSCGGRLQRLIESPVVHYKGSGFYATDSKGE